MFNLFKYIDYALKARKGINKPDELVTDLSFGIVEGYFIISFVFLIILTGSSFWAGFIKGILFFQVSFFFFLIMLIADIVIFRFIKRTVGSISKKLTNNVRNRINRKHVIDVEVQK